MSLYGLVICGGNSSRMGTDKSRLVYYNKPQHDHVYDILKPLCEKVVISCNAKQFDILETPHEKCADLPGYAGNGPIAGILTAFDTFPGHDFLVAGCDYPFLDSAALAIFLSKIKRDSYAAAFYNQEGKYEPLLAWYSKNAGILLQKHFENGESGLQHFLNKYKAEKYKPESEKVMTSVDTPEEFAKVRRLLANQNE